MFTAVSSSCSFVCAAVISYYVLSQSTLTRRHLQQKQKQFLYSEYFFVPYFLPGIRTQQSWKNSSGGKQVKQQKITYTWNIHLVPITRMIYSGVACFSSYFVPCFLPGSWYEKYAHTYPFSTYATGEVGSSLPLNGFERLEWDNI